MPFAVQKFFGKNSLAANIHVQLFCLASNVAKTCHLIIRVYKWNRAISTKYYELKNYKVISCVSVSLPPPLSADISTSTTVIETSGKTVSSGGVTHSYQVDTIPGVHLDFDPRGRGAKYVFRKKGAGVHLDFDPRGWAK